MAFSFNPVNNTAETLVLCVMQISQGFLSSLSAAVFQGTSVECVTTASDRIMQLSALYRTERMTMMMTEII